MIDTIQAFAGSWFTPYRYFFKKLHYNNVNRVLKLNNYIFLYLNITHLFILYKCITISLNVLYYEIMQLNAI